MSTLTTRVAGYKFVIRSVDSEYASAIYDLPIGAKYGYFAGQGEQMPFELRTRFEQHNGQTIGILAAAYEAYLTLRERVEWVADSHQYDGRPCQCDQCKIASAMFSRTHIVGRKGLI